MSEDQKITISLDEDELTVGDLEIMEEVIGSLAKDKVTEAKMTLAMVLIALRKDDPEATVDEARAVKVSRLENVGEEASAEVDPTD